MLNILLFLASCALVGAFTWWFRVLGQAALTAWITILSLLANLFVLKEISLFGLNATASDIFAIGSLLSLNFLQEKYGSESAQQAIWTSFGCLLFFVVMSQIHILYTPSAYDTSQSAYSFLFMASPRLLVASLTTLLIVDQFDSRFYGWIRKTYPQMSALLLSGFTMCLSQMLDTLLFSFLGLYGMIHALVEVILISYFIKLIAIFNTLPWSYITQRLFQRHAAE